jgi:hypothetical protein
VGIASAGGYDDDMADQPKRRFQFRLRTLMIVVTLFCVVGGGYIGWQKSKVLARQAWLSAHQQSPASLSGIIWTSETVINGNPANSPPIIRRWLGDEAKLMVLVRTDAEQREAAELFPEAEIARFESEFGP